MRSWRFASVSTSLGSRLALVRECMVDLLQFLAGDDLAEPEDWHGLARLEIQIEFLALYSQRCFAQGARFVSTSFRSRIWSSTLKYSKQNPHS